MKKGDEIYVRLRARSHDDGERTRELRQLLKRFLRTWDLVCVDLGPISEPESLALPVGEKR